MPGFGGGRAQRLEERSRWNLVFMFLIFAPLAGLAMLIFSIVDVATRWREYTVGEWFWNVVWMDTLGIVLLIGLPNVGWRELQRRRDVAATAAGNNKAKD